MMEAGPAYLRTPLLLRSTAIASARAAVARHARAEPEPACVAAAASAAADALRRSCSARGSRSAAPSCSSAAHSRRQRRCCAALTAPGVRHAPGRLPRDEEDVSFLRRYGRGERCARPRRLLRHLCVRGRAGAACGALRCGPRAAHALTHAQPPAGCGPCQMLAPILGEVTGALGYVARPRAP